MKLRNFAIVAHIDHGKSTLADRIIELGRQTRLAAGQERLLDSMDIERKRGITIKSQTVRLEFGAGSDSHWCCNLIDTPGHVDFSYEVSRSLAATEAVLLLVDASQGVEAQTLANARLAMEKGLTIVPVLSKCDLPQADPKVASADLGELLDIHQEPLMVSGKTGEGVEAMLKQLPELIPAPSGDRSRPLQALVFDAWYDNYLGVIGLVCIKNGILKTGSRILVTSTASEHRVSELGFFVPERKKVDQLDVGEVGYLVTGMKDLRSLPVGDTLVAAGDEATPAWLGFKPARPNLYASFYPLSSDHYRLLGEALSKLQLNDSALTIEPETSRAMGSGFRVGLLGYLHLEIVAERLEKESGAEFITTNPSVVYRVELSDGSELEIGSASQFPEVNRIARILEPMARVTILAPRGDTGSILEICHKLRGEQISFRVTDRQLITEYLMPFAEVATRLYDRLKSVSHGYASMDYELSGHREISLVKLEVMINSEPIDSLSRLVVKGEAEARARAIAEQLKEAIPRQLYEVAIQVTAGGKIIARSTVKAYRKNVTAKLYGGDVTRKKKLLEKQKKGKKRMKMVGRIELPRSVFTAQLARD